MEEKNRMGKTRDLQENERIAEEGKLSNLSYEATNTQIQKTDKAATKWKRKRKERKKERRKLKLLSRVQLFVTPWLVAYQAPPKWDF